MRDDDLAALQGFSLTDLNLKHCKLISTAALVHLKGMPLSTLILTDDEYHTRKTDPDGLAHLRGMPLTRLELGELFEMPAEGLEQLRGLPLTSLDLTGWGNLEDCHLEVLVGFPLIRLNLSACNGLKAGLLHVRELPLLKSLDISWNEWVNDESLEMLVGKSLTDLSIHDDRNVTDAGIWLLIDMPLTRLNFDGCDNLSIECKQLAADYFSA